jgi:hypothetical protein
MIEWPEFSARLGAYDLSPRSHADWAAWADGYRAPISIPTKSGTRHTYRSIGRLDVGLRVVKQLLHHLFAFDPEVHGYVRGRSIATAAKPHSGSRLVLTVDLKGFFGQVSYERVRDRLERVLAPEICAWIQGACFVSGVLPLGYRTSPSLSNIAFAPTDARIRSLVASRGVVYTRWVDDLSFSGGGVDDDFLEAVSEVITADDWVLNQNKTRFMRRSPYVLGLYVGRDVAAPRLPRRLKQKLLLESYYFAKYGLGHFNRPGVFPPKTLFGYGSFAWSIEPDFARKIDQRIRVGIGKSGGRLF